jgi:hypothetical protein
MQQHRQRVKASPEWSAIVYAPQGGIVAADSEPSESANEEIPLVAIGQPAGVPGWQACRMAAPSAPENYGKA